MSDTALESVELPASLVNEIINGEDGAPDISLLQKMTGMQHAMNGTPGMQGQPYLQITEQPKSRGFRFRYGCEGPSHGGIPGVHSEKNRKTYPSVKIVGYQGYARIVVTLMTNEDQPRPHAHYLVGKQCNEDGFCVVQVGPKDMSATFRNLGVLHVTKKNVPSILEKRKMKELVAARRCQETGKIILDFDNLSEDDSNKYITEQDKRQIVKESQEQAKQMDLSAVRVCFQAFLQDENGTYTRTLQPVISDAVFDSKAPNASTLKICRMDRHSGCVTGGDEVFLLCDKVQKDDIQVRFYEEADESTNGGSEWEAYGDFGPADVHRQFAIVFKTPLYHNVAIERPISVHVQLRRKSDGELSDPKPFTYQPQQFDKEEIGKKRKKTVPHFNTHFGGGGPGGPTAGGGGLGPGLLSEVTAKVEEARVEVRNTRLYSLEQRLVFTTVPEHETAFTCERGTLQLSCSDRKTLLIVEANYGRTTASHSCACSTCRTNCRAATSLAVVRAACQGKRQCSVTASSSVFGGDPCYGVQKYLEVSYRCITESNVALRKTASCSSAPSHWGPEKAVDGSRGTRVTWYNQCTHTNRNRVYQPWWKVDLGGTYPVNRVSVLNRGDCCVRPLRHRM
ncbi:PREDICTED: nuclear factor NF-kappa-B p105 subunit-like [Branchiostoma belcheri]|uniref:Nuclear factor NF-kappa-B p105 subunit-like n=1 Tax=Branchiostoma belcheri TaxID=7741 RepID=A0A6P4Y8Z0_BRABE|nr:PREDICTED: nuclear factor NF-kappa-B p105 subunit-like [Branchiostoma belcheri]